MSDEILRPITDQNELDTFCEALSKHDFICVDTEFHRETTYWPELCLIQASGPGVEGIIDPLSDDLDIGPFLNLIAEDSRVKVFHAARQDIEIFNRLIGYPPAPIFDSQIAAMALGLGDSISYDNLIQRVLKRHVDKSSQFTDWTRRPLTDKQLKYALGDVTHLRDAYLIMREQLEAKNRLGWVREEVANLEDPDLYDTSPENAWQRLKIRKPRADYAAIIAAVAAWREERAKTLNKPRRRVLKDDAIYEIAEQKPRNEQAYERLRAISKGFIKSKHATCLLYTSPSPRDRTRSRMPSSA